MDKFNSTLINMLEKEVAKERWANKLRIKGVVINKKITMKGSIMLTVKTIKSEYDVIIPKHKKKEFEEAELINKKDYVRIIGEKNIGVVFCDRIQKINKSINEKQVTLIR